MKTVGDRKTGRSAGDRFLKLVLSKSLSVSQMIFTISPETELTVRDCCLELYRSQEDGIKLVHVPLPGNGGSSGGTQFIYLSITSQYRNIEFVLASQNSPATQTEFQSIPLRRERSVSWLSASC